MRRILQSLMVLVVVVALLPAMASSQVATGTPPFGSFAGGPETINLADLNSHWGFGIVAKAGRGSPFHYAIGFDNSLWNTVFNGGQSAWAPVNKHSAGSGRRRR